MITGSCLCGTTGWEITGPLENMSHCHCSMCRKAHAAPFATYAMTGRGNLNLLSGADTIRLHESSPGISRAFCGLCGSVVPHDDGSETLEIPVGVLDGDPGIRAGSHIFVTSKAPWHDIADGLPQHETYASPEEGPVIEQPAREGGGRAVLCGSCLCGDVAYEVRRPLQVVHNCHCSRCRKARAAAHTTNAFTALDGVVFTRGENLLRTYRLPSAKHFAQVFCTRCGSGMPRIDPGRGIAIIPLGSLDDDPGRGADDHIHVASGAPWYDIADDLPQFEAAPG